MSRRRRPVEEPRHLHLVLDDWSRGYSIRKVDLSYNDTLPVLVPVGAAPEEPVFTGRHSLSPASFRFHARRGEPRSFAGAFGSKILALQAMDSGMSRILTPGVPIYDVCTRSFMFGPGLRADRVNPIYIPVGSRLFALAAGSFEVLNPPPSYDDPDREDSVSAWEWSKLPAPAFQCEHVTSYAMHPDGRTIFVSIGGDAAPATFSLDTVEPETKDDWKWELHGQWQLPFTGHAYFDPELDAWVGLSGDLGTIGHLCSCDAAPTNSVDACHQQCLALKLTKEKLFSEVPDERRIGATLVYMGGESKFCLLECICGQSDLADELTDSDEMNEDSDDEAAHKFTLTDSDEMNEDSADEMTEEQDWKRFFRLTTFSLKYDKYGDLTTGYSRRVQYYSMPKDVSQQMLEFPVAFWM